ncbi:MAG TPA: formate dehydrogenase subunit alpha, partial [Negativicutes bacterium]
MLEKVLTVCPYCGSGCQLYLLVENNRVVGTEPANGQNNEGELCLKGHYGWDFLNDTKILSKRLTKPLIRNSRSEDLREVEWDEALDYVAERLKAIKEKYGPDAIMGTGSSRGTGNETNYIMQKFMRAVIGTNNVDNCARVCHGPSVAGLATIFGSGAMTNSIPEIEDATCLLIFGYNGADSHPIVARRILKAKAKGAKIIVVDPRRTESVRIADLWLPLKNGSNMAIVNSFANIILAKGWENKKYIEQYTEGFDEYRKIVEQYTPEYAQTMTGIDPELLEAAMQIYANSARSYILYGMGVCQFNQAVDVVKGLGSLCMLTGQIAKPSSGIGPVRGQNNVQGACDMGALPNVFPGYQAVVDPVNRKKFAKAWGVEKLPDKIGFTITEVPHAVKEGKLKAYYIIGEDPAQSDPDSAGVRKSFSDLEFVVFQDIFMNKTALHADVILPATSWGEHGGIFSAADRRFQIFRKAVDAKGDVKNDWDILCQLAKRFGYEMSYANTEEIWNECISLCPSFTGATYEKMERQGSVQWPCRTVEDIGTPYLFKGNTFLTASKKAIFFATPWRPPAEPTDAEYPTVLCTVREIGHYSSRTMSGNCWGLSKLADEPGYVQMSEADA